MRILFLGDIVGKPGRQAVRQLLPRLIHREQLAFVVANCENVTDGAGVDPQSARELLDAGVDVLTSGNHIWRRKEIVEFIEREPRLLRPGELSARRRRGAAGRCARPPDGTPVGVRQPDRPRVHGQRRLSVPGGRGVLPELRRARAGDLRRHARRGDVGEGRDGMVPGRQGVGGARQPHARADRRRARACPAAPRIITDAGMCGPIDSVIGVKKELVLRRFLTHMPVKFEVGERAGRRAGRDRRRRPADRPGGEHSSACRRSCERHDVRRASSWQRIRRGTVDVAARATSCSRSCARGGRCA